MKKTTILITALIMLFVSAPQAKAVQMYYTFEGTVDSWDDGAGFVSAQFPGLAIDDIVTYTIIMDFDAPGTKIFYNGSETTLSGVNYFYTDAYSGDYLVSTDGGIYDTSSTSPYIAEYHFGVNNSTYGYLYVNSQNDYTYIYSPSSVSNFSNMIEDTNGIFGTDRAYSASGFSSTIYSSLTLVSILPVSVPEPSTLLLLGSGLLGLGMFRRMRQEG